MKDNKLANITLNAECIADKDKVSTAGKTQIKMFQKGNGIISHHEMCTIQKFLLI